MNRQQVQPVHRAIGNFFSVASARAVWQIANMSGNFRVGLVQMAMSANLQENLEKAAARVEEAARRGAQVICLPEL